MALKISEKGLPKETHPSSQYLVRWKLQMQVDVEKWWINCPPYVCGIVIEAIQWKKIIKRKILEHTTL